MTLLFKNIVVLVNNYFSLSRFMTILFKERALFKQIVDDRENRQPKWTLPQGDHSRLFSSTTCTFRGNHFLSMEQKHSFMHPKYYLYSLSNIVYIFSYLRLNTLYLVLNTYKGKDCNIIQLITFQCLPQCFGNYLWMVKN